MKAIWVLVIVLLVLMILGGVPTIGVWSHPYGYFPSGLLTVVLIIVLILFLTGRL